MENIYQGDVAELELILPRLNIRLLTPQIVFRHTYFLTAILSFLLTNPSFSLYKSVSILLSSLLYKQCSCSYPISCINRSLFFSRSNSSLKQYKIELNTKLAFLFIIKISLYSLIINLEYKFFPHPSYVRRVWLRKMGANAFSETFSILSLTWIQVFSLIRQYCLQRQY